ncbi:hypothetical protein P0082_10200 [Candidatus Haliotispira prima]|uniref:TonB C-terminal domain-containing protein n=1 Tax=Candidatus Haliotispira prima TaxID=3034016 RepID=A0ABY8MH14_9SPIO|nr:hypothetical protein P0082_10200 [Candidatus Haliotispira prima]
MRPYIFVAVSLAHLGIIALIPTLRLWRSESLPKSLTGQVLSQDTVSTDLELTNSELMSVYFGQDLKPETFASESSTPESFTPESFVSKPIPEPVAEHQNGTPIQAQIKTKAETQTKPADQRPTGQKPTDHTNRAQTGSPTKSGTVAKAKTRAGNQAGSRIGSGVRPINEPATKSDEPTNVPTPGLPEIPEKGPSLNPNPSPAAVRHQSPTSGLLPLPLLSNTKDYRPRPLISSTPFKHETEEPSAISRPRNTQVSNTLSRIEPNQIKQEQAAPPPPASATRPKNIAKNITNPDRSETPAPNTLAGPEQRTAYAGKDIPLPGIRAPSLPLRNGRELSWKFEWEGRSQRRLRHLPDLQFPVQMLQGLEDQEVEIIFQVDAGGNVVSASFTGPQLQAYNWQINSLLLEKIGRFVFEPSQTSPTTRSTSSSPWLHKGRLNFHFSQNRTAPQEPLTDPLPTNTAAVSYGPKRQEGRNRKTKRVISEKTANSDSVSGSIPDSLALPLGKHTEERETKGRNRAEGVAN